MQSPEFINDVLIFRIGSLGDTLVALPAFYLIRAQFPHSRITLLTNTPVDGGIKAASSHQILIGSGLIDNYLEYPHLNASYTIFWQTIKQTRQLKSSHTFYLMPERNLYQRFRDGLFFLLAGKWKVTGLYPRKDAYTCLKIKDNYYESEASRLLRSVGFDPKLLEPSLFSLNLQPVEHAKAHSVLATLTQPFIAISLGAKVPAKNWGVDRWSELLEILSAKLAKDYSIVCFGSNDEYPACDNIIKLWPGKSCNLCGKLSPRLSAAVLKHATVFIGHDSGPMHLASSVGTPTISIFASRSKPGVWFPFANEKYVFYTHVPCSNCNLNVCIDKQMLCIRSIQASAVAKQVMRILEPDSISLYPT
jgi:ADP-heptose:LPS heptosyltransferase